ncbi:MAG: dATP pyrophosphohydrolase [Alphaproteobacteria bacterium]
MTSQIEVAPVASSADLTAFIRLSGQLATDDPMWVEPLMLERRQFLSPKHNPFFQHAEVCLFLARQNGKPVGRISAQIDTLAPLEDGAPPGFFGLIDAATDDVLSALFAAASAWLSARGATVIRGPFSMSINETSGLLVDGFDTPPYVLMDHHSPWLGPAIERQGFAKAKDLVAYLMDLTAPLPSRERRMATREWTGLTVRSLDMKRYAAEITTVATIFNDAWAGNWGFTPLTEAEVAAMAKDLKPILDPELVKIAELNGEPAAFIVMLPNINEAIADLDGKLLPFGWAKLLWRLKVSGIRTARVPLMGVRSDLSDSLVGKTLPMRLIYALEERAQERGIRTLELSWLLEDNWPVRNVIENLNSRLSKTYRIYEKPL